MMEVSIMNPDQTATHAAYTIFCSGSILCNQEHIVALLCILFIS